MKMKGKSLFERSHDESEEPRDRNVGVNGTAACKNGDNLTFVVTQLIIDSLQHRCFRQRCGQ